MHKETFGGGLSPARTLRESYRQGVGIMLLNADRSVFMGRRIGVLSGGWQMPQGGIDDSEDYQSAAMRELFEEAGTDKVEVLGVSRDWLSYDLPKQMAKRSWNGKYKGQSQKWFAMRFTGTSNDIDLRSHRKPEFDNWMWMKPARCLHEIIDFKRALYKSVFNEFKDFLGS